MLSYILGDKRNLHLNTYIRPQSRLFSRQFQQWKNGGRSRGRESASACSALFGFARTFWPLYMSSVCVRVRASQIFVAYKSENASTCSAPVGSEQMLLPLRMSLCVCVCVCVCVLSNVQKHPVNVRAQARAQQLVS